jgi:hypothetical protein
MAGQVEVCEISHISPKEGEMWGTRFGYGTNRGENEKRPEWIPHDFRGPALVTDSGVHLGSEMYRTQELFAGLKFSPEGFQRPVGKISMSSCGGTTSSWA